MDSVARQIQRSPHLLQFFWCYASPLGEFLLSLGRLSFTLLPRDFLGSTKRVDGELHVDIKL